MPNERNSFERNQIIDLASRCGNLVTLEIAAN